MLNISNLKKQILNSQLASDSFWAIFGNIFGKGLSLISVVIIARILGKDIYGEFGVIMSTLASIAILSSFGLGYTSTKFIAEYKESETDFLFQVAHITQRLTIIFTIIFGSLAFIFSDFISNQILENDKLSDLIKLMSFYIVLNGLRRTQVGILAGLKQFKSMAKISAQIGVFSVIITFLALIYGLKGALLGALLVQLLNCILNYRLIQKNIVKNNYKKANFTSKLISFSFPVALQEAIYSILTWSLSILLVKYSSYGELGLYSAAIYWSALILFIPGILRNVILSHMSSSVNDFTKHNNILKNILFLNFVTTFSLSVIIYLFSDYISSFYGNNFSGLSDVLNISVFTTIFVSMSNVYAQAYMSKSKNWIMLAFRIIRDGSIIIVAYFLIVENNGKNGALSLVISSLISNFVFLLLMASFYEIKLKKIKSLN